MQSSLCLCNHPLFSPKLSFPYLHCKSACPSLGVQDARAVPVPTDKFFVNESPFI